MLSKPQTETNTRILGLVERFQTTNILPRFCNFRRIAAFENPSDAVLLGTARIIATRLKIEPFADSVAQHLAIIFKNCPFSTRRTRILIGFFIYYLVLIVNPMCRILVRWNFFRNDLEMLCHPICIGRHIIWEEWISKSIVATFEKPFGKLIKCCNVRKPNKN